MARRRRQAGRQRPQPGPSALPREPTLAAGDAEPPPATAPPAWRRLAARWAPWALPPLLALALYANSIPNGFVRDDKRVIQQNASIRDLSQVGEILTGSYWPDVPEARLWRPLTVLTYALNHAAGGLAPRGYHWVNVALHAAVSLLVSALLLALSGSRRLALIGGLLFAAHSVNVEAVANVVGRADVLAALFVLAALLWHRAAALRSGGRRIGLQAAASVAFAAALACKENAITFLALPPLHDACFLRGDPRSAWLALRERWRSYVPYVAVAAAYLVARALVLGGVGRSIIPEQANPLAHVSTVERLMSAVAIVARCVRLFLFPMKLQCDYSADAVPPVTSVADPLFLAGLAVLAAAGALFLLAWRRSPLVSFLVGFAAATYSVTSNALFPIGTTMAERLLYLPAIAACGLAAVGLVRLAALVRGDEGARTRALTAAALVFLVPLSSRTVSRNRDWRSETTLYLRDAATAPECAALRFNAGSILVESGRPAEAVPHLEASLSIHPTPEAMFYLGRAHATLGDDRRRWELYRQTAERFPGTYFAHFAQAVLEANAKRYDSARDHYQAAVDLRPLDGVARFNLGVLHLHLGDAAAAIRELEQATELGPRSERTRLESLGVAHETLGQFDEAESAYRRAADAFPDAEAELRQRALVARGRLFLDRGRSTEAAAALRQAVALDPSSDRARFHLGAALIEAGDLEQAVIELDGARSLSAEDALRRFVLLADAQARLEWPERAAATLTEGLERFRRSPELLEALARLEHDWPGHEQDARRHLRELLDIQPKHPRRAELERLIDPEKSSAPR